MEHQGWTITTERSGIKGGYIAKATKGEAMISTARFIGSGAKAKALEVVKAAIEKVTSDKGA